MADLSQIKTRVTEEDRRTSNRDSVIPFAVGRELFDTLTVPKQFEVIEGGDHNDTVPRDAGAYWAAVDRFTAGLRRR